MPAVSAVGIYNDLASREPTIARRAADHKASCGVDVELGVVVQVLAADGLDDEAFNISTNLFV